MHRSSERFLERRKAFDPHRARSSKRKPPMALLCALFAFVVGVGITVPIDVHAQSCTTSGTSPYQTCTTWQGPELITSSVPDQGQGQYTWGPLQLFDITGAGLGGFMQNWGKQLALNAGGSFSTQTPPTIGTSIYLCYMGNFDGSGRSGMACLADGSIGYSLSTGCHAPSSTSPITGTGT